MNIEQERIIEFASAVRQSTIKRLELIPPGYENWAVSKNALTVSEIAFHLIEADQWLMEKYANPSLKSFKAEKNKVHISNREEYIQLIRDLTNELDVKIKLFKTLTQKKMEEKVFDDRFGGLVTWWWVIMRGNIDHEIHHRGQLSAYIRVMRDEEIIH
ncbi:MAG TPA: DinB family protein [Cyclobacteriaceae bacterium]|jgi:uncharacterized damage-inducible protein DinB|nr:DinB family protein [Cyclobacteriaceae bacterium]